MIWLNHPPIEDEKMKVGVCGTGRMGSSIAERLISVGHEVGVWNRDAAKTKPLVDAGATRFATPAELAEASEVVIAMLLNDAATEAVYRGPNGLLKAKLNGKLVIDMSTVRPDTMVSVGNAVAQLGAAFVECPVGGSKVPAREGKLFGLVGGAIADVARATPLLEQLCRRIEHVGPLGAGATLKLAVNLPLLVYWQALGEALTICKPLNLPPDRLIDILSDTAGAPAAMKGRGAIIARVLGGAPLGETAFGITAAKKDLATAVQFASTIHAELPVAKSALACFEEAEAAGLGEADATTVSVRWTQRSVPPPRP
jgi:3-hydroxyisobutyrate dehydrogenase